MTTAARGLELPVIGLGTAPLGDLYARLDEPVALQTVRAALDAGITLFDTAPLYGHGLAEHRLGSALRQVPRDRLTISSKVGRVLDPAPGGVHDRSGYVGGLPYRARFDYSYDGAWRSLEQSLLRLGLARVDVLLIHDVDVWTHGGDGVEQRFGECMDGCYRALGEMRDQGLVKAIGVGVNESAMCERFARAGDFDLMMLAGRYTLLEQTRSTASSSPPPSAASACCSRASSTPASSPTLVGRPRDTTIAPRRSPCWTAWRGCARRVPPMAPTCSTPRCSSRWPIRRCAASCSGRSAKARCVETCRRSRPGCRLRCGPT